MVKKILLINTNNSDYPPIPLMKFSSYYKNIGYKVKYINKINMFDDFEPDMILITSLFTWEYNEVLKMTLYLRHQNPKANIFLGGICASLLKKEFENDLKGKNINLHFGLHKSFENEELDYTLSKNDYSVGYTTRGCPRKCGWCMVWRLEPEYKELEKEQWTKFIKHKRVLFFDNNILKSSMKHFKEVINYLKLNNISFDFNQGMDARLLTIQHLEILKDSRLSPIRFAFDSMLTDGEIQRAINLSIKYGFTDGSVFILYNFNDSPEDFYYRLKEIIKTWYFDAYPMKFQPLTAKVKDSFTGKHWDKTKLYNFKLLLNTFFNNSLIGRGLKIQKFERIFGKDKNEFSELLKHPDIKSRNDKISTKKHKKVSKGELFEFDENEINKIIQDSEGL